MFDWTGLMIPYINATLKKHRKFVTLSVFGIFCWYIQ